ncbi:MAG: hypothetical protein IJV93_03105, partial [Lentisphaeria bacterium]|nr:hypothetical protein [Lentisphaeria bacterium]
QNSSKLSKRPLLRSDKGSVFPPSHKAAAGQAAVTFPPPHKATAGQARQQVQTTLYSSLRMTSLPFFEFFVKVGKV